MADAHVDRLLAELGERANAEIAQVEAAARVAADALRQGTAAKIADDRRDLLDGCLRDEARRRSTAMADAERDARGALLQAQYQFVARVERRVAEMVRARLRDPSNRPSFERRADALRRFALTADVDVAIGDDGLTLRADAGHLLISDDLDTWLAREAAQLAIDACRALEAEP